MPNRVALSKSTSAVLLAATIVLSTAVRATGAPSFGLPNFGPTRSSGPSSSAIDFVDTPDETSSREIKASTKRLLAAKDFDGLEDLGNKLLASNGIYENGGWHINTFFNAIQGRLKDAMADSEWESQLQVLQEWGRQKPKSVLAKTALADFWKGYGWKARGTGYADTVSATGAKLFTERLVESQNAALEADKMKPPCPFLYRTELILARGNSWDRAAMDSTFDDCVRQFPNYFSAYGMKYMYLMPRWYGKQGEGEQFYSETANKHGKGKEGDKYYARLMWITDNLWIHGPKLFTESALSWARTKSGFEELLKDNPDSITVMSEFAKLADYADDKDVAKRMFDKLGNKCDLSVWNTEENYNYTKDHALSAETYSVR